MRDQYRIHGCSHMYVDSYVLQDETCSMLFQYIATKNIAIHLVLHDVSEAMPLKELDSYGYLSDVLYGGDVYETVLKDVSKQGLKAKNVALVADMEKQESDMVLVYIGEQQTFETLEAFLMFYYRKEKAVRNRLIAIGVICGLYFPLYFRSLTVLPDWMVKGFSSVLCLLLPFILFLFTLLYGIRRKVFSIWEVLDLI